jgi:hypothetical protein
MREPEVVQVEAKMECRHPHDRNGAQGIEAIEALPFDAGELGCVGNRGSVEGSHSATIAHGRVRSLH